MCGIGCYNFVSSGVHNDNLFPLPGRAYLPAKDFFITDPAVALSYYFIRTVYRPVLKFFDLGWIFILAFVGILLPIDMAVGGMFGSPYAWVSSSTPATPAPFDQQSPIPFPYRR